VCDELCPCLDAEGGPVGPLSAVVAEGHWLPYIVRANSLFFSHLNGKFDQTNIYLSMVYN